MSGIVLAVVVASLVGSLHCAGMCGPFAAIAMSRGVASDGSRRGPRAGGLVLQSAYHGGRLVSYATFGAAAGAAGALLDLAGVLAGLSSLATVLAGLTLVGFASVELARHFGVRFGGSLGRPRPSFVTGLVRRATRTNRPALRALAMGLCSALLPCGWLYAFVVTAAGTGRPELGALVMTAFWVGTVPILAAVGFGTQGLRQLLGARASVVASVAVLVLGVLTLFGRVGHDAVDLAQHVEARGDASIGASQHTSRRAVVPSSGETPACCANESGE